MNTSNSNSLRLLTSVRIITPDGQTCAKIGNMIAHTWIQSFVMTFVPLFIVIDAVGNLPFVITLSEGLDKRETSKLINIATMTAAVVGLFFLFLGQFILKIMGISVGAFAIAGGLVLLVLSVQYMTTGRMVEIIKEEMVAVVPIGTPLTVGPATVTTLLLLATQFPIYWVLISFLLNIGIVYVTFALSGRLMKLLGRGGIKAFSRVAALLLAAIAVNMVLRGLEMINVLKLPSS
jgi:multiple antibiotic resistance protein